MSPLQKGHDNHGAGFKLAPAVGSILARLATGEAIPEQDMSFFTLARVLLPSSHL